MWPTRTAHEMFLPKGQINRQALLLSQEGAPISRSTPGLISSPPKTSRQRRLHMVGIPPPSTGQNAGSDYSTRPVPCRAGVLLCSTWFRTGGWMEQPLVRQHRLGDEIGHRAHPGEVARGLVVDHVIGSLDPEFRQDRNEIG